MKKRELLLLAAMMLAMFSFSGCKDKSSDDEKGTDSNSDTDTTVAWDTNHAPDDVGDFGEFAKPPGDMDVKKVPQFVSIGFDDNGFVDSMKWILDFMKDKKNSDGTPARLSFYNATGYYKDDPTIGGEKYTSLDTADPEKLAAVWLRAYTEGHEVGNHTQNHRQAFNFWGDYEKGWTADDWRHEISTCNDTLVEIGIPREEIVGFRTPFLGYNDDLFTVLKELDMKYDCSIEEGWQYDQNGTNFNWPYDLKDGSQVDSLFLSWEPENTRETIGSHPGVWEMPMYPVVAPPDYKCAEYGIPAGLRTKMLKDVSYFGIEDGKVTGLDWNMVAGDEFSMNKAEVVATLKYTLDLRLKGNRAPFVWGAHTPNFSLDNTDFNPPNITILELREALEEFITYALSKKDVIIIPQKDILQWIQDHTPADSDTATDSDTAATDTDSGTDSDTAATDTDSGTDSDTATDSAK
ncbi:MAG: polysaccharide deacetylase family protein [Deltaproteobacteria bacterium]|nr:polysaccharide deacetylase family protein [Deltaproteobacteria bacterium]